MRSCQEITKLISKSIDHPLPWRTSIAVRMHIVLCRLCNAFRRDQLALTDRLAQESERVLEAEKDPNICLSAEAKKRLANAIGSRLL
ncbi:anti-sigma factor family protein [Neorhodopirellula lusitana]|uniref:anti-sigma factor family protein n=1 Tax=Neorhodopirellula lusitana TaxID=445327 RepID=UPI0038513D5F